KADPRGRPGRSPCPARPRRARPARGGGGPRGGALGRRRPRRPRTARERRPPQRRGPLPLLAAGGDRRRPGPPPPPLPRGRGELEARLQHRLGGAHRQRLRRTCRAHRGTPPLEPARCDGDRPLPARPPPPRRRRPGGLGGGPRPAPDRDRQSSRRGVPGDLSPAPLLRPGVRPGGARPVRGGPQGLRLGAVHRPVRFHPLHQRGRGRRGGDARLGPRPCVPPVRLTSCPRVADDGPAPPSTAPPGRGEEAAFPSRLDGLGRRTAHTMMNRVESARWPGELRSYQRRALEALEARWASGDRRAWVVLPPGAGKTLVGLEAARRIGRRTVVFVPNTALQNQWVAQWREFERPEGCTAGTQRSLEHDVTVLTYQSLAVFDPDAETDEEGNELSLLGRLHGNGSAL